MGMLFLFFLPQVSFAEICDFGLQVFGNQNIIRFDIQMNYALFLEKQESFADVVAELEESVEGNSFFVIVEILIEGEVLLEFGKNITGIDFLSRDVVGFDVLMELIFKKFKYLMLVGDFLRIFGVRFANDNPFFHFFLV